MMKRLGKPAFARAAGISAAELAKGCVIAGFLAFFFYRSVWAFLPMMIPAALYLLWERRIEKRKKGRQLLRQFSECILSVSSSVRSGYAAENAFLESMKDMEMMFGKEAGILRELKVIQGGLENHTSLERLLRDMGQRTGLEEVKEFAEIFAITKRNGGNLADVIHMTAQEITEGMVLEEEMNTLLASKRLEQKIMNLIPFLLIIYLEFTTPGYFGMFFGDVSGIVIMTLFLIWYVAAYGLSEYILWGLGQS